MKKLLWLLFVAAPAFAARPSGFNAELRSQATAGNLNGCLYVSGYGDGTDYSQQNTFQSSGTILSTNDGMGTSSCTVTAVGYDFSSAAWPGNSLHVTAGVNWLSTSSDSWHIILATATGADLVISGPCSMTTNVLTNGTFYIGGACSLGSTLDDDLFETNSGSNTYWMKNDGTYGLGEVVSIGNTSCATFTGPCYIRGYNTTRGDDPTGSSRPVWAFGANTYTNSSTAHLWFRNLSITGTAVTMLSPDSSTRFLNSKIMNMSATAGRQGFGGSTNGIIINSEFVTPNGIGFSGGTGGRYVGNYIHDCSTGSTPTTATNSVYIDNLFEANSVAFVASATGSPDFTFVNNTFYGRDAKQYYAIGYTGAAPDHNLAINNLFYGWTAGITYSAVPDRATSYNDSNNFYNVTISTNKDSGIYLNTYFLDPQFFSVQNITGTTATTSGSVLTDASADFSTVVDSATILHVTGGTGVTTGGYLVTGHSATTLTVTNALGSSVAGDVTYWFINTHNHRVGTNLKDKGYPTVYPATTTNNYLDIGAAQLPDATKGFAF